MKRLASCLWAWALLWAAAARAEDLPAPVFLPATAQATAWIEADPLVARARHGAEAARHAGDALAASSHEWTARLQGQRRSYQDGAPRSAEWSAQLERAIRVNGKAGLDLRLRDLEVEVGRARLGEARHESARALVDLWTGVIVARQQQARLREQAELVRANLDAVARRKRAGDASALDVHLAQAEVGDADRELSLAGTALAKREAALRLRFGAEVPADVGLSEPQPPFWPEPRWRERVLAEADPLKSAEGEWRRAGLQATRARAERLPDPTVGVFTASEARRNERVVGLSLSIPLPGDYRSARALQAGKEADALQAALEQVRRDVELDAAETWAEAAGSLERWRIARETARLSADAARLMQRAYTLGEADLQALLLARRQAADSARAALEAQGEALRWQARLLVDAHLIWDLAND